jgi:hypothetical protein
VGDIVCCPLSEGDEPARVFNESTPIARREHKCCECDEIIPKGARYELARGLWDGRWSTFKTCLSCVEIRDHFGCEGWVYEMLWSDLEENFFPDMKAGGPCMDGLSPSAKARLFERRIAWLFRGGIEVDGAPPPEPPRPRGEVIAEFDPDAERHRG